MKLFAVTMIAIAAGENDDKRIPPKGPLQRLEQLERFAKEWLATSFGFDSNKAEHWSAKFQRNTARMEQRFQQCGHDESANSDRKRRSFDENMRIDFSNPIKSLKQITTGYRKWAERYLDDCKNQPKTQSERARKWNVILKQRFEDHKLKNTASGL